MGEAHSFKSFAENGQKVLSVNMGMKWAIEKCIKINPIHQHNIDEDINLQKAIKQKFKKWVYI
jgi:hypothetical protein